MSVTIAISKPVPAGQPLVWAEGRQALCESLPYYRAYQSGGYCSNGFAYGFMFDGHCHPRDYIDQTVVIARSGGGLSKNQASGAMVITEDQRATSSQVQSVMRSKQHFNPVVILLGAQNPLAPSKMPHAYNVLDWFKPTHVWAEKSDGKVVVRYRFEKLNPKLPSWWAPGPVPPVDDLGEHLPPQIEICQACQKPNPQVYVQGWMCLDPDCLMFWKLSDGREPDEAALTYDKTFLKQFTAWPNVVPPYSVRPDLMTLSPSPILGEDVSQQAAKGFVCPNCGRCNSREMWTEWRCQSTGCGFTHKLKHSLIPSHLLRDPYAPLSNNYPPSRDKWDYSFPCQVHFRNNYRIHRLSIPGTGGFIEHWIANKTVLEEKDGPDTMFEELQTIDIGLRRRALQSSQIKGPQLCQHFTVNFGMPYKFIAAAESNSFDDAPGTVRNARSRLNWVARQAVGSDVPGFNEVLAIGYFEKQDIDFHDDGEHGLGPTIATLSLGSPGTMTIRMKQKHWLGVSRTGLLTRDPPIPGCVKYEQRAAAHRELEELKVGNSPDYKAKVEAIPRELNLQTKHGSRVQADPIAELRLNHGDVVIMHGEKIQQYYEVFNILLSTTSQFLRMVLTTFQHSVSHEGKLRFALTCRYIQDNHLKEHERPNYAVKPDDVNYDGSKLPQFPSAAPSTCNPTD